MSLAMPGSERLSQLELQTGLVCMVCHTNRYSAGFRSLKRRLAAGELAVQHIMHQTMFFRRTNQNRFGQPRSWVSEHPFHQPRRAALDVLLPPVLHTVHVVMQWWF